MAQTTLVNEQIEAGSRFLFEFQKRYSPLLAAFWLKESEREREHLYVASEKITDDNFDVAYREVLNIAETLKDPWFDPFRVKLIFANNWLVKSAKEVFDSRPFHPGGTRMYDTLFGGVRAEEVYLYPVPITKPVFNQVEQTNPGSS